MAEDITELARSFDNEINPQTIPEHVWHKLRRARRDAHEAPMHRGRFLEQYSAYLRGVADALEVNRDDLDVAVAIGWPQLDGREKNQ